MGTPFVKVMPDPKYATVALWLELSAAEARGAHGAAAKCAQGPAGV